MGELKCSCAGTTTMVMACSGGSNVGQIANEVAKRLEIASEAKFYCLAGVGAHVSGVVASVKGADKILVIDGCGIGCGKKCLHEAGFEDFTYMVVTDMGVNKNYSFDLDPAELEKVTSVAREKLAAPARSEAQNA